MHPCLIVIPTCNIYSAGSDSRIELAVVKDRQTLPERINILCFFLYIYFRGFYVFWIHWPKKAAVLQSMCEILGFKWTLWRTKWPYLNIHMQNMYCQFRVTNWPNLSTWIDKQNCLFYLKKRQETVEQCQAEWGGAHLNSSNFIMEALIHRECDGVQRVPHVWGITTLQT